MCSIVFRVNKNLLLWFIIFSIRKNINASIQYKYHLRRTSRHEVKKSQSCKCSLAKQKIIARPQPTSTKCFITKRVIYYKTGRNICYFSTNKKYVYSESLYYIQKMSSLVIRQKDKSRKKKKSKARQIFRNTNNFYSLIRTSVHTYEYQGVRNVHFSENLECFVFLLLRFEICRFALLPKK